MTRPLALRESQVRAIIRAARKEGVRVEVKIGEATITVIPEDHNPSDRRMDKREEIRL